MGFEYSSAEQVRQRDAGWMTRASTGQGLADDLENRKTMLMETS